MPRIRDHTTPPRASGLRAARSAERRTAIFQAALDEFSERGFASARIEDVARRAGVAKGTIYLHFRDKEALFAGLVAHYLSPTLAGMTSVGVSPEGSIRALLERELVPVLADLGTSPPGRVIRLMITEGARFPRLAEVYHRDVIVPGLRAFKALAERAVARGEMDGDVLSRFPQLLFAPAIAGLIWRTLFDRFHPLDVEGMLKAQLDLIFRPTD